MSAGTNAQTNGRIIVTKLGGPETLRYMEESIPEPGPGEVRVKVLAAGVAFADVMMRRGMYPGGAAPPFTPGYDIVGDVDKIGIETSRFSVGRRVGALIVHGGYSEYTIVAEDYLVPVPESVDPAEAVSLILNYVTAYQMLHRVFHAAKGQRILIHGAAGGVGTALLQLGALAELTMFGTASKSKHATIVAEGGVPIDYRSEDFTIRIRELTGDGVDCVFDAVGGWNWWRSYGVLRKHGILICYGASASVTDGKLAAGAGFALLATMKMIPDGKKCEWFNVTGLRNEHPDWFREDIAILYELLATRKIHPVIGARFPLREAAKANELIEGAGATGKIVLLCQ
jgi:NADPH:quinone reductase-like Zn-dependent oxidoreductase